MQVQPASGSKFDHALIIQDRCCVLLMDMNKCPWCDEPQEKKRIANHTRWCEKNPKAQEYREKVKRTISKRAGLPAWNAGKKKETDDRLIKDGQTIKEGYATGRLTAHKTKHAEKAKKILSQKRKEWLANNPDKHPWKKSSKFLSVPCEHLKSCLREKGLSFEEEFQPLSERFFSVDIAFLKEKLAIEVNGEQHYNRDGTLKKYYAERHSLLEQNGWNVLELHYAKCYKPETIQLVINLLTS